MVMLLECLEYSGGHQKDLQTQHVKLTTTPGRKLGQDMS